MAISFIRAGFLTLPPTRTNEGANNGAVVLSAARLAEKARAVEAVKAAARFPVQAQEVVGNSYNRAGQIEKTVRSLPAQVLPPVQANNLPARVDSLPPVSVDEAAGKIIRNLPPVPVDDLPPKTVRNLPPVYADPIARSPIQQLPPVFADVTLARPIATYPPVDVLA